jgi:hypothetical protein
MNDTTVAIASTRRGWLAAAGGLLLTAQLPAFAKGIDAEVWKDASCGCCKDWIAHLEANGVKVRVHESGNEGARGKLGVGAKYASCHTALIGGYAIEGHVPAREIQRLLRDKPQAVGLAVPGMPVGAPGMDGAAYGGKKDAYSVLLLTKDGGASVYQRYEGKNS